ncbi:MAG: 30S ribosomal protein S21 [Planctomycetes bacterium]|nr:30S ribosomal protein S21 [Planctomycetota bacterium]MCB9826193.1 30S ribosomal protein S21 [Planctomycetota bacterium]MCB9829601.1 30S ribosomal protein S21 [Planctomycetota bacterium]
MRRRVRSVETSVRVQAKANEPLEKTLRRLRKLCNNEGITRELKRHAYYEKPSEKRRRRKRERIKAIRLAQRARDLLAQ